MRTHERTIVVGVDRSAASLHALRWALDAASRTGATVEAVHAYDVPVHPGPSIDAVRSMAYDAATALLRGVVRGPAADHPDVTIRRLIRRGPPGPALVDAATGARLLVVGTTVANRLAGLALGSTAQYCATHARCPVVVLRPDAALPARASTPARGASGDSDALAAGVVDAGGGAAGAEP